MKHLLGLSAAVLLLSTACKRDIENITPIPPYQDFFSAYLSESRYGLEQLDNSSDTLFVKSSYRYQAITLEITPANGLKNGEAETIRFNVVTNMEGSAKIPFTRHDLCRYKDGPLYVRADLSANHNYTPMDTVEKEEYKIRTYGDLANIENSIRDSYPDQPFVQVQDITCPDNITYSNSYRIFSGSYDGQNYKIKNFNQLINNTSSGFIESLGLFGSLQPHSVVKNIRLELSASGIRSTSASCNGGGIAALADSAAIINCSVKGNITADTSGGFTFVGGIVGRATNCSITGCSQSGNLTASVAGGIISLGTNDTIKNCYKTGGIYVNSTAGGIMAYGFGDATINVTDTYVYLTELRARYYYALYRKSATNGVITNYYTNKDNIVNPFDSSVGNTGYTLYSNVAELNNYLSAIAAYKANPEQNQPMILSWQ